MWRRLIKTSMRFNRLWRFVSFGGTWRCLRRQKTLSSTKRSLREFTFYTYLSVVKEVHPARYQTWVVLDRARRWRQCVPSFVRSFSYWSTSSELIRTEDDSFGVSINRSVLVSIMLVSLVEARCSYRVRSIVPPLIDSVSYCYRGHWFARKKANKPPPRPSSNWLSMMADSMSHVRSKEKQKKKKVI